MRFLLYISLTFVLGMSFHSCQKDTLPYTKNHLNFSVDTLLFDTVFTTLGSTTQRFLVYNRNNNPITIDEIELMGGSASNYRLNIDGLAQNRAEDIEIAADDSMFVFAEVTLDPNNGTTPMIVEDSIRFKTNGENQFLTLATWGQDAYFHTNEVVSGTWANDKPHVIYGQAAVGFPGIDSNLNLTIPAGTKIHLHDESSLIIYKSSLTVNGMKDNEVKFLGDRLEPYYDEVAGQWNSIRFIEANPSTIDYAIVKNGITGLQIDSTGTVNPTLQVSNTIVQNMANYSILVNAGAYVEASNCVFGNSGAYSGLFFAGGKYTFTNCTFGNNFPASRSTPLFKMQNYFEGNGGVFVRPVAQSRFTNCIFYGGQNDEFELDTITHPTFDLTFDHCLIKKEDTIANNNKFINTIWNENPLFVDETINDFHLESGSPAINSGTTNNAPSSDIEGNMRSNPDIGAYEHQ